MNQQYEVTFMHLILIYIVKLTYNNEYIFLYSIFEMEISRVSNTTVLIHQFQFLTNVPLKNLNKLSGLDVVIKMRSLE